MWSLAWWKKYWRQSYGSDFHRDGWAVEPDSDKDDIDVGKSQRALLRPGPDLTDFILFKAARNHMSPEMWRTRTLSLSRADPKAKTSEQVDIYEMFWADLSRLASSVPRIVSELFTLLFRLSVLGRDTVRIALATRQYRGVAWSLLRKTQTSLDWAFSRVLSLLTMQLAMLALIIIPVGLLRNHERVVAPLVAGAILFVGYLAFCYLERPPWLRRSTLALLAAGAAAAAGWWVSDSPRSEWLVGLALVATLTATYVPFTRAIERRFPFSAPIAWVMWAGVVIGLLTAAVLGRESYLRLDLWTYSALRVLEVLLGLIVLVWAVIGIIMVVWFIAGAVAVRTVEGDEAHAIVSTGRLGVFASGSFFLLIVMLIWALLSKPLELAVGSQGYAPMFFTVDGSAPSATLARDFLASRYRGSTEMFSLIAIIDLLLLAYLVIFFLPSVLAELKVSIAERDAGRLGRWLSVGYDNLDKQPIRWLSLISAIASAVAAAYLGWWLLFRFGLTVSPPGWERLAEFSQDFLAPFVLGAGTLTLALTAFGGVLSRYLPGLRAPLDIALDVDNHFREFPREAIPRARIVARYLALLRHVDAQGYDRIVIVAHSQGTVITTELLRYMRQRAKICSMLRIADPDSALVERLVAKTQVLTLGCPLRQLYATRFPTLYPWVRRPGGPKALDLGVQRWINGYTTGDYVGRWLWHENASRYEVSPRDAARTAIEAGASEIDICLGAGAHTHYFEAGSASAVPAGAKVVDLIDELIRQRYLSPVQSTVPAAAEVQ